MGFPILEVPVAPIRGGDTAAAVAGVDGGDIAAPVIIIIIVIVESYR